MVFEPRSKVSCYQKCHCHVDKNCSQPAGRSWRKWTVPFRGVSGVLWIHAGPRAPGTDLVLPACASTSSGVPSCVPSCFLALTHTVPHKVLGMCDWWDEAPALRSGHGWGNDCMDRPHTGAPRVSRRASCSRRTRQTTEQQVRETEPAPSGPLREMALEP